MSDKIEAFLKKEPNTLLKTILGIIAFLLIVFIASRDVEFKGIQNSTVMSQKLVQGLLTPDTSILFTLDTAEGVPYLLLETLCIAFLGTIIGGIIAIPFSFIASHNIVPRPISIIGLAIIAVIRTFPAIVYGLMFIRVTGPGAPTGVMTLSVVSIGMIAKLYIEAIEDLDRGILESLDAAGCNLFEKIRFGVLPQLYSNFISTVIYRFEINIRDASVLGLVGAGGIGSSLMFAISSQRWHQVGSFLIGLVILVLIIEQISVRIRNKLARG